MLHRHEPARHELTFQYVPDLLVRRRAGESRNRDGDEQRPVVRHAATSFTTRSRSDAPTGASGGRTRPPYSPPPTAAIAALAPAGPRLPPTSRPDGARRTSSLPSPSPAPEREAAETPAAHAPRAARRAVTAPVLATRPPPPPPPHLTVPPPPPPPPRDHCGALARAEAGPPGGSPPHRPPPGAPPRRAVSRCGGGGRERPLP